MKKSSIIYILALVMIVTLSIALTYTQPVVADTTATSPYPNIDSVTFNDYFTQDGTTYKTTENDSKWGVIRFVLDGTKIAETGTFYITCVAASYQKTMLLVNQKDNSTVYYQLVAGEQIGDLPSGDSINQQSFAVAKETTFSKNIDISKSQVGADGKTTLYIAFEINEKSDWIKTQYDSLTLSNIRFVPSNPTINFSTTDSNATITATCGETALTTGSQVELGSSISLSVDTTSLSSGNQFYFWTVNGEVYSTETSVTITADSDKTIVAEIHPANYYEIKSTDGKKYWHTIKEFLDDSTFAGTAMLMPNSTVTLTESATLRSGVTLLVPFNDAGNSCADGTGSTATWTNPNTYRYSLLTINEGVTLTINGTLVVGATYGSTSGPQGIISGYYGEIVNNGVIELNGTADIYGLITGNGKYNANSGSTTTITFVFVDFAGGSNTSDYYSSLGTKSVFPFSQYSCQNIWCNQQINTGAVVNGRASIYASSVYNKTTVGLIVPNGSSGLLQLANGYLLITYDSKQCLAKMGSCHTEYFGQMTLSLYGDLAIGSMKLSIMSAVTVDSSDYILGVPYSLYVNVESGTLTISKEIALLPGATLNIKEKGNLNVTDKLYVLDGLAIACKSGTRYPYATELSKSGFCTSGKLTVDGTMDITGTFVGIVQTSGNTGKVTTGAKASLKVDSFTWGATVNKRYNQLKSEQQTDTTVKMKLAARFGRNSIATSGGVSSDNSFVEMETGKTYYALTSVGGNTIQTKLTTAKLTSAENITNESKNLSYLGANNWKKNDDGSVKIMDCTTVNSDGSVDIAVNSTVTGTFYEKDSSGNYIVPVNVCVGKSDGTVSTDANGYVKITNAENTGNLSFSSGELGSQTLYIKLDADGNAPVTYYTTDSNGDQIGPDGNQTAYFDGTGTVMLTHVVQSATLGTNHTLGDGQITIVGNYTYDGANYTYKTNTLYGIINYYGGESTTHELTGFTLLGEDAVSGTFAHTLYNISISATVYQTSKPMALYQYNCSQLATKGEDNIVAEAKTLYGSWKSLNESKNANEQTFIQSCLGSCNTYFGIYNQLTISTALFYGDTTKSVSATATKIDGTTETVDNLSIRLSDFATATISGQKQIVATITYSGSCNGISYVLKQPQVVVNRKAITVVVSDVNGHTYGDASDQALDYKLQTGSNLVGDDKLDQIVSVSRQSGSNAGTYNITGERQGDKADFYDVTFSYTNNDYSIYTISKKNIKVDVKYSDNKPLTAEYGASVTENFVVDGVDGSESFIIKLNATKTGNYYPVGKYGFTITDNKGNYNVTTDTQFIVTKRNITVEIENGSSYYGDTVAFTHSVVSGSILFEDEGKVYTISCGASATASIGDYNITGKAINDNYDVTFNYTNGNHSVWKIVKRQITVEIYNQSSIYGNDIADLTANVTSGFIVNGDKAVYTLSTDATNTSAVGTYSITGEGKNDNYEVTFVNGTYTINKREITVKIAQHYKVYGGNGVTALDEDKITLENVVTGEQSSILNWVKSHFVPITNANVNASGYDIKFNTTEQPANYTITYSAGKYVITQRPITVKIDNKSSTYGDGISNSTEGKGGLTVTYATDSLEVVEKDGSIYQFITLAVMNGTEDITDEISSTSVGTYAITGTNVANSNYAVKFINEKGQEDYGTYTINPREIEVTVDDVKGHVYGNDVTEKLSAKVTSPTQLVKGDELDSIVKLSTTVTNKTGVGEYSIIATYVDESGELLNGNYSVIIVNGKFEVVARPIIVKIDNKSSTYGDGITVDEKDEGINGLTVSLDNGYTMVGTDNIYKFITLVVKNSANEYITDKISSTDVGTYSITGANVANSNYDVTFVNENDSAKDYGIYTITAREIAITVDKTLSSKYGNYYDLTDLISVSDEGNSGNKLVNGNTVADVFDLALQSTTFAQTKARRALASTQSTTSTHLDAGIYGLSIGLKKANYKVIAVNDKSVTIVASGSAESGNTSHIVEEAYTIKQREITITIGNGKKTYDGAKPDLSDISITITGAVKGQEDYLAQQVREKFILKVGDNEVTAPTSAGEYTISSKFTGNSNYIVTATTDFVDGYQTGKYTINKRPMTVSFGIINKIYGDTVATTDDLLEKVAVTSGTLATGDSKQDLFTLSVKNANSTTGVGNYDVVYKVLTDNYQIDFGTDFGKGKYVITAKDITLVVTAGTSVYGDDIANSTVALKDGFTFVGEDTFETLNGGYTLTHGATKGSKVGTYQITAKDSNNTDNYNISFEFANDVTDYIITKRPITITIGSDAKTYDGVPITDDERDTLKTSGGAEWTNLIDTEPAESLKDYLTLTVQNNGKDVKAGGYEVTGTFSHDNYEATTINNGKYTINPRKITVTIAPISNVIESVEMTIVVTATMDWNNQYLDSSKAVYVIKRKDTNEEVATIENNAVSTAVTQGEYIVCLQSYDDGNFKVIDFGSQDLKVIASTNRYMVTIDFGSQTSKTYDGNAVGYDITVTDRLNEKSEVLYKSSLTKNGRNVDEIKDAGEYTVGVSVGGVTYGTADFTIAKRPITITIDSDAKTYDGKAISDTVLSGISITINGAVKGQSGAVNETDKSALISAVREKFKLTGKDVNAINAGSYVISSTFTENDNYVVYTTAESNGYTNGTYTIKQRPITVKIDNKSSTYGDGISNSTEGNDGLTVKYVDGSLEVVEEDGSIYKFITLAVMNGTKDITDEISSTSVGTYAITGTNVENSNYAVTFVNNNAQLYTITARPVTVVIDNITNHIYGNSLEKLTVTPAATSTTNFGFVNGDADGDKIYNFITLKVVSNVDNGSNVDVSTAKVNTYYIVGTDKSSTDNYDVTFSGSADNGQDGIYTITPRPITVKIDDKESIYGDGISNSTEGKGGLTVTYATDSLKVVEEDGSIYQFITLAVMNGTKDITNEISSTDFGTYSITGANVANSNYAVTFVNENDSAKDYGIYTITAREIAITVTAQSSQYGYGYDLADLISVSDKENSGNKLVNGNTVADVFDLALQSTTSAQTKARRALASTQSTTSTHLDAGTYGLSIALKTANYKVIKVNDDEVTIVASGSAESGSENTSHIVEKAYTIKQREITITIGNGEKTYDGTEISDTDLQGMDVFLADKFESNWKGLIGTESDKVLTALRNALTLSVTNNSKNVKDGGYTVTGEFTNTNYQATITPGTYKITPCQITVSVSKAESVYDNPLKANLLGNASIQETIYDSLDKILSVTTTAQEDSPVNLYDLHVELISGNYIIVKIDDSEPTLVTGTTNKYVVEDKYGITARKVIVNIQKGTKVYDGQVPSGFEIEIKDDASVGTNTYTSLPEGTIDYTVKLNNVVGTSYINVGTYTISGKISNFTNYSYTVNDGIYTITKRPITITIGSDAKTYDGKAISDTVLSGISITINGAVEGQIGAVNETDKSALISAVRDAFELSSEDGKAINAGSYVISSTFTGNNNYVVDATANANGYTAGYKNGTYIINKRSITITISNGTKVYDGNGVSSWDENVTISIPDAVDTDLAELISLAKSKFKSIEQSNVNTSGYDIAFYETEHKNYTITYSTGKYTITSRPVTVVIDNVTNHIYGDPLEKLTVTPSTTQGRDFVNDDGDRIYDFITLKVVYKADGKQVDNISTAKVGTYYIVGANSNSNYAVTFLRAGSITETTGIYTITSRQVTVQISKDLTKVYDGSVPDSTTFSYKVTDDAGVKNYDTLPQGNISYTLSVNSADVGTYTIYGTVSDATNYTYKVENGTYTITPREIQLTVEGGASSVYGESIATDLINKVTIVGDICDGKSSIIDVTTNATQGNVVGTYNLFVTLVNTNYRITKINGNAPTLDAAFTNKYVVANKYEIKKRAIAVTIKDVTSVYGDKKATLDYDVTSDYNIAILSGDNDVFTVTCDADSTKPVGSYDIIGQKGTNKNYDVTFVSATDSKKDYGTYTIEPRTITVTVDDVKGHVYGNDVTEKLSAKITSLTQLVNDDKLDSIVKLSTTVTNKTGVGKHPIIATDVDESGALLNGNYSVTIVNGTFEVVARPVTVTIAQHFKVYDGNGVTALDEDKITLENVVTGEQSSILNWVKSHFVPITNANANTSGYNITFNTTEQPANYTITYSAGKYVITKRPVTYTVNSATIYRYKDNWTTLNGILNDEHLYGEVENVVEGETLKFTYKVIAKVDELGNTIYLTEDNFNLQIKLGAFVIKAMATDDPVNANYDITYVDGTLNVELPKVSVNADNITQTFTYSSDGINLFNYADQINGLLADDKLPTDNANARSFKAELRDKQGNVVLEGTGTLSGVVPAGDYKLVISIVQSQYYQWDDVVTTEYEITVEKKDISDFIILQGLNEYLQGNEKYQGWITNVRGGVYAEITDENYENIRVDSMVKFNDEEVFDLTQCGEYVLKATINDANYWGEKEFTFCVIQSVATEMGKLMTMSNEYSSKDDFATRLININQMKAVVETIKANADYMLQVEQNKTYQTYIDKVDTLYNQLANDWTDYVNYNKQDVEIAKKVWQDTVAKAVATITLLGAATFVAKRRLGL